MRLIGILYQFYIIYGAIRALLSILIFLSNANFFRSTLERSFFFRRRRMLLASRVSVVIVKYFPLESCFQRFLQVICICLPDSISPPPCL